jgi:uncharacterized protein YjiS (DUF1127 family)
MTLHETFNAHVTTASPRCWLRRWVVSMRQDLVAAGKRLQYVRMKSVLQQLSNQQLAAIGLRRRDIPAYAYSLIYEP